MDLSSTPRVAQMVNRMIEIWPEHKTYLERSFADRDPQVMAFTEELAKLIEVLAKDIPGGMDELLRDYRYLCETITLPEEINFRRTGKYRLSKFEDAVRDVYANSEYMRRYMNGLLISNAFWSNHAASMCWYVNNYLTRLPPGANHLEIGPGHGVYLYLATQRPGIGKVVGWDVSEQSIKNTRHALNTLGVKHPVDLVLRDLFADEDSDVAFDSIVMSEILEHLEDPLAALKSARRHLKPGGYVWINVPANSPAPDHIYLVDSPEAACELVKEAGLNVVDWAAFPMSGNTLEKARKRKLAISCLVLGQKPA